jgi:hypothetical protein
MRRAIRTAACVVLLAGGLDGGAAAQTEIAYADRGETLFRVTAPAGWRVVRGFETPQSEMPDGSIAAPRLITVGPEAPQGLMWAGFWSPPGLTDIESPAAARFARTLAADLLESVSVVQSRVETINGVTVRVYGGEGVHRAESGERETVRFDLALAQLPEARVAVGAFIGSPEARAAHGEGLAALLASLEAVR